MQMALSAKTASYYEVFQSNHTVKFAGAISVLDEIMKHMSSHYELDWMSFPSKL